MMKPGTLVHVRWVDSTWEGGWVTIDGIIHDPDICESVGWLVRETRDVVTVAGHRSPATNGFCGVMTIPRVAVMSVRQIREKH